MAKVLVLGLWMTLTGPAIADVGFASFALVRLSKGGPYRVRSSTSTPGPYTCQPTPALVIAVSSGTDYPGRSEAPGQVDKKHKNRPNLLCAKSLAQ